MDLGTGGRLRVLVGGRPRALVDTRTFRASEPRPQRPISTGRAPGAEPAGGAERETAGSADPWRPLGVLAALGAFVGFVVTNVRWRSTRPSPGEFDDALVSGPR